MVSEHENAEDRGRLPAHEVREVVETSLCLLENKQREGRHRFVAFNLGFFCPIYHMSTLRQIAT